MFAIFALGLVSFVLMTSTVVAIVRDAWTAAMLSMWNFGASFALTFLSSTRFEQLATYAFMHFIAAAAMLAIVLMAAFGELRRVPRHRRPLFATTGRHAALRGALIPEGV